MTASPIEDDIKKIQEGKACRCGNVQVMFSFNFCFFYALLMPKNYALKETERHSRGI